tara:strand:+ start:2094 stop:2405 length:312 start_codon:yes stop_codon:yes gene_type:complete
MDPLSVLSLPMTMMNVVSGLSAGIPVIGDITPKTDGPLSDKEFGSYIASVICLIIMIYMIVKMPFKTPPIMLACCCSLSSCSSSTSRIVDESKRRMASSPAEE